MANIFFDIDGVLIRSRYPDKSFLWSKNIDRQLKMEQAVNVLLFKSPEWNEIICGRADFTERLTEIFARHQVSVTVEHFISFWLQNDLNWYHDVLGLLTDLKQAGHALFIASNQDRLRTQFIREQVETRQLFKHIFTSSQLGVSKPEVEFFLKIKEAVAESVTGVSVMIDDAPSNIESAAKAGLKGIYFNPDLEELHTAAWLRDEIERILS